MTRLSPSLRNLITKHLFLNVILEHPVFGGISEIYDFILENIEPRQFSAEQFIIKEGQKATHMYILEQGTCEILVKGQINRRDNIVREIGHGTIFGEIALIYGTRRTASVRSKESCMVGALSEENFNLLIRYFPEIMDRLKKEVRKY